ncbi:hypothetical protein BT69DRAFT_1352031 [Atractiella rhizophila]|nr:hypothetical protein BT69DRAFT_1352031 [Atractiella rhizophila]
MSTKSTLLAHLLNSLATLPGTHSYTLRILRSRPKRSHSAFPYASNPNAKVYVEELLVLLTSTSASTLPNTRTTPHNHEHPQEHPHEGVSEHKYDQEDGVPIFGLEAHIYTVPSTSTALVYISKVDTTGLLPPNEGKGAAGTITAAFVSYFLSHPHRGVTSTRIHVFARSQSQYLFPGSAENVHKKERLLDDKRLCGWWKRVLSEGIERAGLKLTSSLSDKVVAAGSEEGRVRAWFLLPGFEYIEAKRFVNDDNSSGWTYGHPYTTLSSPVPLPTSTQSESSALPRLGDLVPSFPDDPKSRFLNSLTSSRLNPAGERNDWDEEMYGLRTEGAGSMKRVEVERERERERKRLEEVEGGADEFWERMAWRQECCDGHVGGFFVVAREEKESLSSIGAGEHTVSLAPHPMSLPTVNYIPLWSTVHNLSYTTPSLQSGSLVTSFARWVEEFKSLATKEGSEGSEEGWKAECEGKIQVNNKDVDIGTEKGKGKRKEAEKEEQKVNTLVPRKKKKVA